MNQELEALIKAFIAAHECDLRHRSLLRAHYEALLEEALQKSPGVSREVVTEGIRRRALAFVKAQSRPPALPPQA
jgi:hypothetical protein